MRHEPHVDSNNHSEIGTHLRVARLAARQHGVVGRTQLLELGFTESQVDYAVNTARLFVVHPGIYALRYPALDQLGQWSAAVLAAGPDAYLSHRSAALLRAIITRYDGAIEVTVARHHPARLNGVHCRTATFHQYETGSRLGIPATSKARILLELATVFDDPRELTRAFQRARERGVSVAQVDRLLERHKGERGTKLLRTIVDRHRLDRGIGKGGFEDAFYEWLLEILPAGFPRPQRNVRVALGDGTSKECDLVFAQARAIIELNFFGHHGGDRVQSTFDAQRARQLRQQGWALEVFTSDEFDDDRPRVKRDVLRLVGLT